MYIMSITQQHSYCLSIRYAQEEKIYIMKPIMTHSPKEEFYLCFPYTSPYVSLTRYHSQNNDNLEETRLPLISNMIYFTLHNTGESLHLVVLTMNISLTPQQLSALLLYIHVIPRYRSRHFLPLLFAVHNILLKKDV